MTDQQPPAFLKDIESKYREKRRSWLYVAALVVMVTLGYLFFRYINTEAKEVARLMNEARTIQAQAEAQEHLCGLEVVICPGEDAEETKRVESVEDTIRAVAASYDYADADFLVALARCESTLNPDAVGGETGAFRGLFQWNRISNPEVDDSCAFSPHCSTIVTIQALNRGEAWRWPHCPRT